MAQADVIMTFDKETVDLVKELVSEDRIRQIVRDEIAAWEKRQLQAIRSRGFLIDIETKGSNK
jgi:hypothetical protein